MNFYCPRCGYKYPKKETEKTDWGGVIAVAIILVAIWLVVTLVWWGLDQGKESVYKNRTLLQIIQAEWHWIKYMVGKIV